MRLLLALALAVAFASLVSERSPGWKSEGSAGWSSPYMPRHGGLPRHRYQRT